MIVTPEILQKAHGGCTVNLLIPGTWYAPTVTISTLYSTVLKVIEST